MTLVGRCCHCQKVDNLDGVNLRGFHRSTGDLLWEHLVDKVIQYVPCYGGRIPVLSWLPSELSLRYVEKHLYGGGFYGASVPPYDLSASQIQTWELKPQHIDIDTGNVVFTGANALGYALTPKADTELNISSGLYRRRRLYRAGNPTILEKINSGQGYRGPLAKTIFGYVPDAECSSGFLTFEQSSRIAGGGFYSSTQGNSGWSLLDTGEDGEWQKYIIPARPLPSYSYHEVTAARMTSLGYPEATVTWAPDATAADVKTALESLPQIEFVLASGGPLDVSPVHLELKWLTDLGSFTKIDLVDMWVEPDPPIHPEHVSRDQQVSRLQQAPDCWLTNKSTGDIIGFRRPQPQLRNYGQANNTTSQWAALGDGNIAHLYRFGEAYDATDDFDEFTNPLNLVTFDADDFEGEPKATLTLCRDQNTIVANPNDRVGFTSTQRHIILGRSVTEDLDPEDLSGKRSIRAPDAGFAMVTFDGMEVVFNQLMPPHTDDGSRIEYHPSEPRGFTDKTVVLSVGHNGGSTNKHPNTNLSFSPVPSDPSDSPVTNTPIPDSKRLCYDIEFIVNRDIAMSCSGGPSDDQRMYTGRSLNAAKGINEFHQGLATGMIYQDWRDGGRKDYALIPGAPDNATLSLFSRIISTYVPLGLRFENTGTLQWRCGIASGFNVPLSIDPDENPSLPMTRWLPWDADLAAVTTELRRRFGTYMELAGDPSGGVHVGFTSTFTTGQTAAYINHEQPFFQTAPQWRLTYSTSLGRNGLAAAAAGVAGIFSENVWPDYPGTARDRVQAWTNLCRAGRNAWIVQVRDSATGQAPNPYPRETVAAMRWDTGEVEWQRNFGILIAGVTPAVGAVLGINHQGNHIYGFGGICEREL